MASNSHSPQEDWKDKVGGKIREELHNSYRKQVETTSGLDEMQLVITLLGDAGKEEIMKALTGIDYKTLPTEEGFSAGTVIYDVRENIFFADTPWDNIRVRNPEKHVEEYSDLVLWFTTPEGQLTAGQMKVMDHLAEKGIPVLALSLNVSREEDEDISASEMPESVAGVSRVTVDPESESSVKALSDSIVRLLRRRHKEMLYLRITPHREGPAGRWVMAAAATALGIAVLPLPGSDDLSLTALQSGLCLRIAYIFESTLTHKEQMALVTSTVTGRAGRRLAALAADVIRKSGDRIPQTVKGIAMAASRGLVAAAITYGIGMACLTYYKSGLEGKIKDLTEVFRKFAEEYLKNDE